MGLLTERERIIILIFCLPPKRREVLNIVCRSKGGIKTKSVTELTGRRISNVVLDLEKTRSAKLITRDDSKSYLPSSDLVIRLSRTAPYVCKSNSTLDEVLGTSILLLAREMVRDSIYPGCRTMAISLGTSKQVVHAWACRLKAVGLWPSTNGLHWTDCRIRQQRAEAVKAKMPDKPYKRPLGSPRMGKVLESDRGRVTPYSGRFK